MDDELSETAVQAALTTQWLGRFYHYLPTIGSTNDVLKERVVAGDDADPPAGTILLADYQSQGRGRFQRRWQAPPGSSLLLSLLFRPNWPVEQAHWITMMACLAAAAAMEAQTGLSVGVKWPNDLVIAVKGEWRKAGGLLPEGNIGEDGRLASVILGVGINVNLRRPPGITPTTSLLAAGGQPVSRLALLVDFLGRLEMAYETADRGQSPQPAWNQRLVTSGQQVRVTGVGGDYVVTGVAEGTDTWGRLLVRDENGRLHTIAAGDVTLRRVNGKM